MHDTSSQATDAARRAIGAQIVILFVYAAYGIGFGLLAVVVGSFAGFSVAMVGAAHLAFGALAALPRSTALPATRGKYAALAVTHTIALLWGLAVTIQVSGEDPLASLILGAVYLPHPIAGISLLCIPSVFRLYWTGRLPPARADADGAEPGEIPEPPSIRATGGLRGMTCAISSSIAASDGFGQRSREPFVVIRLEPAWRFVPY